MSYTLPRSTLMPCCLGLRLRSWLQQRALPVVVEMHTGQGADVPCEGR